MCRFETQGDVAPGTSDESHLYRRLVRQITDDATGLFAEVLDFVENGERKRSNEEVVTFEHEIADTAERVFTDWMNTLRFFESFSLGKTDANLEGVNR